MSATHVRRHRPLLLWPVVLMWRLVTLFANLTGILLALVLGLVFMMIGLAFCSTIVGAIVGIPLFLFGFLLLLRGLY